VGPRAKLDRCRKSCLHWVSIPGMSGPQRVAILTTLSQSYVYHTVPLVGAIN